ncbi:uncharacterized protein LOC133654192 isoform X1 [Entelurus aequoreus]|uniref:uncharacterized protein LOC133654192 isoform X1 n=1 Tax=Entelurus aequoreus TaxID=161455 RepID=UPI002B1E054C|nr:uncharacterized protein LOC133654192 isoform X1 [Entelurus aequoreus]
MSSMKRMVEWEDPQTFLDVFEATATSCKWPEEEWGAKLLPLLVGEAQRAGLSLPATARMQYPDLRHAILDRVGSSPEDHRRKFRAIKLGPEDQPFVLAYRMRDAATRWLEPNGLDSKMLESIILEQFIDALPAKTSAWVQYHSSPDVKTAVKMAEEHLAVQREATAKTAERPTPAPRPAMGGVEGTSREQRPRTAEPPGANEQGTGAAERGLPSQMAPQTPGPVCWGCGQPGHVRRECSMMEVGQVMRVVGPPAPDLGETYCVPVRVQGGTYQAVLSGSSGTAEREPVGASREAPPAPRWQPTEDFPLEQSRDETLRVAWDQVDYIDGQLVRPGKARVFPHFTIIRDRLYRVGRDTQTGEEHTQLLVPKRRLEMVFQAAHFNPMSGHMRYDKTLNRVMVHFYWPGLRADVRRWCQLVNPAGKPSGHPKGAFAPNTANGCPVRENWDGPHRTISPKHTGISL